MSDDRKLIPRRFVDKKTIAVVGSVVAALGAYVAFGSNFNDLVKNTSIIRDIQQAQAVQKIEIEKMSSDVGEIKNDLKYLVRRARRSED